MKEPGRGDSGARVKGERCRDREKRTIRRMVEIYCRKHHGRGEALCGECRSLLEYAMDRIERCPYPDRKPVCSACEVHCYRPEPREKIRRVMRYAGPRMLIRHPVLALLHLTDMIRRKR